MSFNLRTTSPSAPSDYTSVVREEVVFQAGQRSAVFSIATSSDGEKEPSEVFKVNLTSTDSECVVGTPDEAFVTIVDESGKCVGVGVDVCTCVRILNIKV